MAVITFSEAQRQWIARVPKLALDDAAKRARPGTRTQVAPGSTHGTFADSTLEGPWCQRHRALAQSAFLAWGADVFPTDIGLTVVPGYADLLVFAPDGTPILVEINRRGTDKIVLLSGIAHAVHEHGVGVILIQETSPSYPALDADVASLLPQNTAIHESALMLTHRGERLLIAEAKHLCGNHTRSTAPPPPPPPANRPKVSVVIRSPSRRKGWWVDVQAWRVVDARGHTQKLEVDDLAAQSRAVFESSSFHTEREMDAMFWQLRKLVHDYAERHGFDAWIESKHLEGLEAHQPEFEQRGFLEVTRRLVVDAPSHTASPVVGM